MSGEYYLDTEDPGVASMMVEMSVKWRGIKGGHLFGNS